jgi:26S proteasome regulatory subunit N3
VTYIIKGVESSQNRLILRAIRFNPLIRKHISSPVLSDMVNKYILPSLPSFSAISAAIQKLPVAPAAEASTKEASAMDIEESPPVVAVKPLTSTLPEVEVYIFTLVIMILLREKLYTDAMYYSTLLVDRIRSFNRRSLDFLASKAFFYFSLAYEKQGKLENIRSTLLALYRTACIHQDEYSQAMLLNLILRNYLYYNLFDQAHTLSLRSTFPENASHNQFCRYLYYMGRIQATQAEYSEAYQRLMMAARKAPQDVAVGFSRSVHKLIVIVQLLMGEIPERSLFNQPLLRTALTPYFHLTQAVRNGDLQEFNAVSTKYAEVFKADHVNTMVKRLSHNVLKTGLRKISISYSRISLQDVAEKLHLASAASAEYICAKAIKDGVIEATIDHENGWITTNETVDLYSTEEPQKAFHKYVILDSYCTPYYFTNDMLFV